MTIGPRFASYHIDFPRRDPVCPGCGAETKPGDTIYWIPDHASQDGDQGAWVCRECALRADQGERINTRLVPRMEAEPGCITMVPPWDCPDNRLFTAARARELWPGYLPELGQPDRVRERVLLSEQAKALSGRAEALPEQPVPLSAKPVTGLPPKREAPLTQGRLFDL